MVGCVRVRSGHPHRPRKASSRWSARVRRVSVGSYTIAWEWTGESTLESERPCSTNVRRHREPRCTSRSLLAREQATRVHSMLETRGSCFTPQCSLECLTERESYETNLSSACWWHSTWEKERELLLSQCEAHAFAFCIREEFSGAVVRDREAASAHRDHRFAMRASS